MMLTCLFLVYLVSNGRLWVHRGHTHIHMLLIRRCPEDEDDDERMEDSLDTAAASTLFGKVFRNRLTGITGDIRYV